MNGPRRVFSSILCALLLVSAAAAEEPEPSAPAPAVVADHILRGTEADLKAASRVLADLDDAARLRVLGELQDQARVVGLLLGSRVRGLRLEAASLEAALGRVLQPLGLRHRVSPKVVSDHAEEVEVHLRLDGVSVATVLSLLTEPYDLEWLARDGVVWIVTAEEGERGVERDPSHALRMRLERLTVDLSLSETTFAAAVKLVGSTTGIRITIDPRIADDVSDSPVTALRIEDLPLTTALTLLQAAAGPEVVWTVRDDAVVFTARHLLDR